MRPLPVGLILVGRSRGGKADSVSDTWSVVSEVDLRQLAERLAGPGEKQGLEASRPECAAPQSSKNALETAPDAEMECRQARARTRAPCSPRWRSPTGCRSSSAGPAGYRLIVTPMRCA
jgi:hypothetical protein